MMDGDELAGLCRLLGKRFLLGQLAILNGFITDAQLAACLEEQRSTQDGRPLGAILLARRLVSSEQLADLLQQQKQIEELDAAGGAPFAPERMIGHYAVREKIGGGGAGEVWKAWDTQLHRWVAVKQPHVDSHFSPERFLREARAAAKLRHPSLIETFEFGQHYIVMNFVDGRPLDRAGLDARRAAELLAGICDAVQYMHSCGVLHRDIKPQNIIVDAEGRGCLGDFGLAKDLASQPMTVEGKLMGTPYYMAPEQATGRHEIIGPRTDVYGLGATLYHAVGGHAPFETENDYQVIFRKLMNETPAPPQGCPPELAAIILHAMEKDPRDRYESAAEMGEDLRRYLRGEPIIARPAGPVTRGLKWIRRNAALAAATFVALGALGLAAAVLTVHFRARRDNTDRESAYLKNYQEGIEFWMHAVGYTRGTEVDPEGLTRAAEEAMRRFDAAARSAPHRPEPWLMRGRCLLLLRRGKEAEAAWGQALQRDRHFGPALLDRGKYHVGLYVTLRLPAAARDSGGRIRFQHVVDAIAGEEWRRKGEESLARAREEKGLDPLELRYIEGALAFGAGRHREAAEALREYVLRNSWDASALALHGAASYVAGDFKAAEESLGRAINLEPRPDRYKARGDSRYAQGKYAEAVEDYTQSLKLRADDREVLCNRGFAHMARRDFERAIGDFTRAIEQAPSLAWRALGGRGVARSEQLDFAAAEKDFLAALELWEFYAEAYNNLGSVLVLQKRPEEAIRQYSLAIECDRNYPEAHVNRGMAYLKLAELEKATSDFETALKLDPDNPDVLCELATAWHARGDTPKAIALVRRAFEVGVAWPRRERAERLLKEWAK